jgi:hypothetical protein
MYVLSKVYCQSCLGYTAVLDATIIILAAAAGRAQATDPRYAAVVCADLYLGLGFKTEKSGGLLYRNWTR